MAKRKHVSCELPSSEPRDSDEETTPKDFMDVMFEEIFTEGIVANSPSDLLSGKVSAEDMWVKMSGWTPLEFLAYAYRNPWYKLSDRIQAAKSILEYVHKKVPQKLEIQGDVVATKKLSTENLSKLSDKELELFVKLMEKMNGA